MAAFLLLNYKNWVLYGCSCSQLAPLGELYFCRHCKVPRCEDCVYSAIDSYSCPHCFESVPVGEAKNRKNRCNHCYQCPKCASTLTTRSVIVPSEVLGEQSPQKRELEAGSGSPATARSPLSGSKSPGGTKLYFLTCTHCKWNTHDVKIRDKRSPMEFRERPSPHQPRITALIAFYKEFAQRDKVEREKVKKPGRRMRSYGSLLDPSKFTSAKFVGSESPGQSRRASQLVWDDTLPEKMAAKATEDPQPPPEELYTAELKLQDTSTLKQRFMDPNYQPSSCDSFWPRPLHLTGKKFHRCKGCDHILLKAELSPSSIRFKIQQIALHTFPQVRIVEFPALEVGKPCEVLVSVTNPVNYSVTISFEPCPADVLKRVKESLVNVSLPEGNLPLTPIDDVVDLLEDLDSEIEDDPKFVHSRLPGKLILKFVVIPESAVEETKFMFLMKFTHKSTLETDKPNETSDIQVPVLVNAGRISSV